MEQKSMTAEEYLNDVAIQIWKHADAYVPLSHVQQYKELVIQEYRDSLIDQDALKYLQSIEIVMPDQFGEKEPESVFTWKHVEEALSILQAKHQKQIEGIISKEEAKEALFRSLSKYEDCECSPERKIHGAIYKCPLCLSVDEFMDELNRKEK